MKRLLYFYPHKFSNLTDGSHSRIVAMLHYFKSRGICVDMISYENPNITDSYLQKKNLVNQLFLIGGNPFIEEREISSKRLRDRMEAGKNRIKNISFISTFFKKHPAGRNLPNWVPRELTSKVKELIGKNSYQAILVTYLYWAHIVEQLNDQFLPIKTVIDPNDFLTLQQFYFNPDLSNKELGEMFGEEIERMSYFDAIIHISQDEYSLFSNFIPQKKHYFIPQFFEKRGVDDVNRVVKYDILFIASGNAYNREGINWFLEEVYPCLSSNTRIAIAGNICQFISFNTPNIFKLGFVENASELYNESHCTICPLKRGSGIKIKVIESLSYGLPVVSTSKGIDGFKNKEISGGILVADDPKSFADALNRLIKDQDYYKLQSSMAVELFDRQFSTEVNYKKLDEIFTAPDRENA